MSTTVTSRLTFSASEETGTPLAINSRSTPLSVRLSYSEAVEGCNMVWSMSDSDSAGGNLTVNLDSAVDDRGTVSFTAIHGYTVNIRSGTITFPPESDVIGSTFFFYQPLTNANAISELTLTGPATLSLSSAAALGDATTASVNKIFAYTASVGADYDIIFYGVGTVA